MDRTRQSLQAAIKANHEAQEAVMKELETTRRRKKRNRQKASVIQTQVPTTATWEMAKQSPASFGRHWTKCFFVGKDGTVPLTNEDSKLRFELEKDKVFIHQSPLWSRKEITLLYDVVKTIMTTKKQDESESASEDDETSEKKDNDASIDFEQVATALHEKFPVAKRSAEECRVKYQPNRAAFTKKESLTVLKQHHNGEDLSLPNRTKWQAFQAYHAACSSDKKVPWTVEQDEVLFKTVAAAGPQHVMDQHFAHNLSAVLEKHPKTIMQRTTTSLLNPTFVNDQWTDTDERRLCLLMKVYRESPNAMVYATSYFPNRSSRSVHDKWSRTLDPSYDLDKHFTPEEDEKLKQLKINSTFDWKDAEKQFPGRLSQSLTKRWKELVSKEDVVEDYSRNLKRKKFNEFDESQVVVRRRRVTKKA